jgi:hypothetical protein
MYLNVKKVEVHNLCTIEISTIIKFLQLRRKRSCLTADVCKHYHGSLQLKRIHYFTYDHTHTNTQWDEHKTAGHWLVLYVLQAKCRPSTAQAIALNRTTTVEFFTNYKSVLCCKPEGRGFKSQ